MRPGGDVLGGRSRKDHDAVTPTASTHGGPTAFFLATEEMLNRSYPAREEPGMDSTFGVRSLEETQCDAAQHDQRGLEEKDDGDDKEVDHSGRRRSTLRAYEIFNEAAAAYIEQASSAKDEEARLAGNIIQQPQSTLHSTSHSMTSLSQGSQLPGSSLPSSPKSSSSRSFRPSDEDSAYDGASQAIASSEEEETDPFLQDLSSAPQLIMPSIKMPSRRPFTSRGKSLGRLKILVAGDSGVGKSSFIKSVVQSCEDIVHIDQLSPSPSSTTQLQPKTIIKHDRSSFAATTNLTEAWASTRPYPQWWLDIEENKAFRRRKSMGDSVLERNLCFVDTPGYSQGLSITEGMNTVLSYIEQQLVKPFSANGATEGELIGMLSGSGGTQVDVVLYLIAKEFKPADLDFIQRLSLLTNVVPLISKSDGLSRDDIQSLKDSIRDELTTSCINCFEWTSDPPATSPYAVCSAPSGDEDNMDASLLMSSDYIQPLLPSELGIVIEHVFEAENIARLRYLSSRKLIRSRTALEHMGQMSHFPTSSFSKPILQSLTSATLHPSYPAFPAMPLSPSMQEKFTDYAQREEKLARLRLAKWAGDLQNNLREERAKFEELQYGERTAWLSQKMAESTKEHGPIGSPPHNPSMSNSSSTLLRSELVYPSTLTAFSTINDPLGILRCYEALRRRGWMAVQVVGSFGVLGAIAVWISRNWGDTGGGGGGGEAYR